MGNDCTSPENLASEVDEFLEDKPLPGIRRPSKQLNQSKDRHHSNMFVEVFLYTKVTNLIHTPKNTGTPKADDKVYHYSLDYLIRYNGREMTWIEHLNHAKPLHKA